MQGYIDVIVKGNKIIIKGQEFLLGELSVSLMNMDDDVLRQMSKHLVELERLACICREKHVFYRKLIDTDKERKAELAQDEHIKIPTFDEWIEIHEHVCAIQELMQTFKMGEVLMSPVGKDFMKHFENAEFGTEQYNFNWMWYLELLDITMGFVEDVFAVLRTFRMFTVHIISFLKKYDINHLAGAYHILMCDPRYRWMVASFNDPDKVTYTDSDFMILQYKPMYDPVKNEYIIAEYFRMDNLQAIAKTDMLRGLMKGHFPRRCENCGRYFLMTKAYRTRFCDMPSPEDPKRTCNQMAYAKKKVKEEKADDPKYQSYRRCIKRIEKAFQREALTEEQKELLLSKAEELYTKAMMAPEYSNEEFEAMLQSKNLYKSCGIDIPRKGRPKKGTDDD